MLMTTGSGSITQSVGIELGEERNEEWSKSENGFRKHKTEFIQTEMVRHEGFDVVIDREKKGNKIEYRLDVLFHEASFNGRSKDEVIQLLDKWIENSKKEQQ